MFLSLPLIIAFISCIYRSDADPSDSLPKHVMPCGLEVPPIGLGSFGDYVKNDLQKVNMFLHGIENGYKLFDVAYEYDNERNLGLVLKSLIEAKKINRTDILVITKAWNTFHTRDGIVDNIRCEIRDLGVSYSDFGLFHYPTSLVPGKERDYWPLHDGSIKPMYAEKDKGYLEAYRGLEAAQRLGLIRHIGVANLNVHQLKTILEWAYLKPVVIQVECHPLYQNNELANLARDNNMTVICYSPLRKNTPELIDNEVLKEVAEKVQKTVRQVALRWNMQRGNIVIPRSYDKYHQKENIESLHFELDNDDMEKINGIPGIQKVIYPPHLGWTETIKSHPDWPFDP